MMTEAARAEPGGGGRRWVGVDRWKGMSLEQQSAIHRDREKQCLERQVCEVTVQHETAPGSPNNGAQFSTCFTLKRISPI